MTRLEKLGDLVQLSQLSHNSFSNRSSQNHPAQTTTESFFLLVIFLHSLVSPAWGTSPMVRWLRRQAPNAGEIFYAVLSQFGVKVITSLREWIIEPFCFPLTPWNMYKMQIIYFLIFAETSDPEEAFITWEVNFYLLIFKEF